MIRRISFLISFLFLVGACSTPGTDNNKNPLNTAQDLTCSSPIDCPIGFQCEAGQCVAASECMQEGCVEGQYCDGTCQPLSQLCAFPNICSCHISNTVGQFEPDNIEPRMRLTRGATQSLRAMVTTRAGMPLHGLKLDWSVEGDFEVVSAAGQKALLRAGNTADAGTITASLANDFASFQCEAHLEALLPGRQGFKRVRLVNDLTGETIKGGAIQIGVQGQFVDAIPLADGTFEIEWDAANDDKTFDVHAFAPGHHILSVVGVRGNMRELLLPLGAISHEKGGISGEIGFDSFAKLMGRAAISIPAC